MSKEESGYQTPQEGDGLHSPGTRLSPPCKNTEGQQDRGLRLAIPLRSRVCLTLKNSGSVARDHLASERTFLAYVRTSLAIVTAGIAIFQLFISSTTSASASGTLDIRALYVVIRVLSSSMIILGMVVLTIGAQRYFAVQVALTTGVFPAARLSSFAIAAALMVLALTMFCALLSAHL